MTTTIHNQQIEYEGPFVTVTSSFRRPCMKAQQPPKRFNNEDSYPKTRRLGIHSSSLTTVESMLFRHEGTVLIAWENNQGQIYREEDGERRNIPNQNEADVVGRKRMYRGRILPLDPDSDTSTVTNDRSCQQPQQPQHVRDKNGFHNQDHRNLSVARDESRLMGRESALQKQANFRRNITASFSSQSSSSSSPKVSKFRNRQLQQRYFPSCSPSKRLRKQPNFRGLCASCSSSSPSPSTSCYSSQSICRQIMHS